MIAVDKITKSYGPTRALKGVGFNIEKGEIVGFLGPNGAGKSTTMKILTCYIPADSGKATVAGYDVFDHSIDVRRHVGYLPENAPLYTDMPVVDFLKFCGSMRGIKGAKLKSRVKDVIDRTGLSPAVGKNISELSKGYRQRVCLAQSLLHEPDVLILDEPTSGLDPNQIKEIRDLIREIGREKTVILSTHIMAEVTATCDRAIIIADGRVVASGTPDELAARSGGGHNVIARLKGPQADIERGLKALPGVTGVRVLEKEGSHARYDILAAKAGDLPEQVFRAAVENKWVLTELRQDAATLEDVFSELTKQ